MSWTGRMSSENLERVFQQMNKPFLKICLAYLKHLTGLVEH